MSVLDISRRAVLAGGVAGAGAAGAVKASAFAGAPAIGRNLPDVVVVGAGAFGGWSALTLREQGARVTLVDLYGAGNVRASSAGETRNIRASYGERDLYTRMASRAWDAWQKREESFGRRLIYKNGSLRVLAPDRLARQIEIFDRLGLPYELLEAEAVNRRWPQVRFYDGETIFFEQHSGSVKARESMVAVEEAFVQMGGVSRIGQARPGSVASGRLESVMIGDETCAGGQFVFACGPWLPKVLPEALSGYIKAPRAELFFIGSPPGDPRYRFENVPNITDLETYTSADFGSGYKVGAMVPGVQMDMDNDDRIATDYLREKVERFVARRLPGLVGQPIVGAHVCQTENSDNHHYIIDRHPDLANAWIAGGGSGHAFKMGPVLGEIVAAKVLDRPDVIDDGGAFALSSHRPY
ncbi:FAD-dependent oxidoreductase [Brevundimonas sp.]|jgi:sarcosine oxidase|uniref:FAD-dependent oxidoreductase n=1 Tax=Brevundimonas sp. TaxID=1871086 RepID=UPI0037BF7010